MAVKHGWFVPFSPGGSSYHKTPHNGTVEVTHVGDTKTAYDCYPGFAPHYVGEITEWVAPGAKSKLPYIIASPGPTWLRWRGQMSRW